MNTPFKEYQSLIQVAQDCICYNELLDVCRVLCSVLVREPSLFSLPITVLEPYTVTGGFKNVSAMTEWLEQLLKTVKNPNVDLITCDVLTINTVNSVGLNEFNQTGNGFVISIYQALSALNKLLNQLWLHTRRYNSYYTRVLNPSMEHVYHYLLIYIRIIENEQRQNERHIGLARQRSLENKLTAGTIDADDITGDGH